MAKNNVQEFSYLDQHVYEGMILPGLMAAKNIDRVKNFKFEGDVVISSYPKCGSTWTQEMAWLVMHDGDAALAAKDSLFTRAPYLEQMLPAKNAPTMDVIHELPRPTTIKTHLPAEYYTTQLERDDVKFIIPLRNPKDALVSFYEFHRADGLCQFYKGNWNDYFELFTSGRLAYGNLCRWYTGWLKLKNHPKVLFVRYEDMKKDLPREVRRIANFLGKKLTDDVVRKVSSQGDFKVMKENRMTNWSTLPQQLYNQTISPFMRSGKVGEWKNYFTEEQSQYMDKLYEEVFVGNGCTLDFE